MRFGPEGARGYRPASGSGARAAPAEAIREPQGVENQLPVTPNGSKAG